MVQGNLAAITRTYERKDIAVEQRESWLDQVMHWLEREETPGQRVASYGLLGLAALYFLGAVLRAVF